MPYRLDEEQTQRLDSTAAPPMVSGVSTGIDVNVPQGAGKPSMQGPQKSGQYQNIQQYLQANQPQAAEMAGKLASGVEQKVGEAQAAGTALQAEPPKVGEFKPQDILSKAQAGTATEAEKQSYQQQKSTGGYTGPTDITGLGGYGEYFKKSEAAKTAAEQAGSEYGQRELLKQTFARPNYTQGATTLDQSLLAQSQPGQQALANLQQKYSGLGDVLKGYESGAAQNIQAAQQQAAKNIASFAPAEQAAQAQIMNPIQQQVQQAQADAAKWQQYKQNIQKSNYSPEMLAAMGLTPGQQTFGVDVSKYITPETGPATIQNIASASDREKYNNLMNFLGKNTGELGLGQPSYQGAGFNKAGFEAEVGGKANEYQKLQNTRAGDIIGINPGSSGMGLGVNTELANALNSMNLSQITQWYNSLPATSRDAGVAAKDSFQIKQLKQQLDQLNNQFNPTARIGLEQNFGGVI